ncbi:CIC11C00000001400 [Sungouiella intermedia]|uniref:CIC11C00000001400 n=1 Tax=Sungouiella intermedia TaxID=45354 RepID=A0A1L0CWE1_9ASCO|nr:CIC11C00000001400 [[Candida] intermedia]
MESGRRHEIGNKIVALGGTHYTDLMSSVQYLVVGKRNTEKYRYSIRYRHDMVFLTEEAVTEIHSRWVAGHDYGLDLDTFRLPIFLNFTVCVARVEKPSSQELVKLFGEKFRNPPSGKFQLEPKNAFKADEIIRVMSMLGAKVSTTLTPTCDVLVGTDTAGRRYTMANEWKIPAVHPLWVFDSCLRGAALDLDDYVVNCEVGNLYNNGSFVWKKLYSLHKEDKKTTKELERRERGQLKKNLEIWSSIMENTRSHTAQIIRDSTWDDPGSEEEKGSQTNGTINNKGSRETAESEYDTGTLDSLLFLGFKFLPVGYLIPQQKVLKKVVESHHGEIADSGDDDTITHILLLVKNGPQANLMLSALSSGTKRRVHSKDIQVVTDWFIERSIYYNEARHDNWSKPLQGLVPLATRYKVCVSGFTGVELLHIEKLVGYLNLEFCEVLNSNRDLLIINVNLFRKAFLKNSPELFEYKHKDILNCPVYSNGEASRSVATLSSKNKINAAKKWNIPIVSIAYLWEMIERLTGKSHLQMPDILDLSWCIFAPQAMARPTTLLDFVRKMSNNFSTQGNIEEANEEESVQLPSPRKSKDKPKYGRLAGGGESLTEKLKRAREETPEDSSTTKGWHEESFDNDDNLTQVGYANQDSINSKQELMRKLEGTLDRSKRSRRAK